ncbi:hypothetical protein COCSUDRAFT_46649 [Coccomyxa subellipsoidea C-169]|uniref:Uncharacterized protein n=1 Tax=Coccomyxa subellipsoidea (strain C-169) TaxID=574566 RepID=I0Z3L9_COCSC|nr:hypothetical protein COCSUDRAFT_46649 [Coccomyxa subellipsoidea C-169]EIE25238.1 hypothetical protein COCSUDRAFT_46649 [Coccomyxa subellipsoidea C-169]|eukprot:XP_005649782.1 hypothetical protein COCSUDRAFT_46649 [Coccomyxa subellipsoidea C-169]
MTGRGLCTISLTIAILLSSHSAQVTGLHVPHFLVDIYEGIQAITAAQPARLTATHLFVQTASSATLSREAGLVLENVPLSTNIVAYSKTGMLAIFPLPYGHTHATSVYAVEFAGPAIGTKDNADLISPAFTNPNGAWLGAPQAALVGEYDGQKAILLLNLDRPIYQPSEDRLTYTAVHTLPLDKSSFALENGAINKLVEQYTNGDNSNAPLLLKPADIKESIVLSDVSLFIDAAFVPAKHSNRRWLQDTASRAPAPSPSAGRLPALPSWFAPGGPGNPVSRDNPSVIPGAPLPGYADTGFVEPAATTESVSNSAATLTSLPEAWAPGFAPGPAPDLAPVPAPGPAADALMDVQAPPSRGANPVLCMTAAGPSDCATPAFGANGVGSLGGPRSDGASTSASGWSNYGYSVETGSRTPGSNAYSVNRYQPKGGVWGPYSGRNG